MLQREIVFITVTNTAVTFCLTDILFQRPELCQNCESERLINAATNSMKALINNNINHYATKQIVQDSYNHPSQKYTWLLKLFSMH